jgi:hypothetical protein
MTEKITIKLTIAVSSDGISIETVRWLQGNRDRAIAALQDSCKPEIIAYSNASDRDLNIARLEALAYHEYRAKVLRAQLYGHLQPSSSLIDLPTTTVGTAPIPEHHTHPNHNGKGKSPLELLDKL